MDLDLHIHSVYSYDSILKPETIIKIAKERDLAGVAITDHGTIKGGLHARKFANDDFIVIVGSEVKTEIGDITGLSLNEEIKSKQSLMVIDEIKDQGGLAVLPHPYRGHKYKNFDELIRKIDVIEGYNARTSMEENNRAQELAKEYNLPVIAGSDAHFKGEIGLARTIMDDVTSQEDVRKFITKFKTQVTGKETPPYFRGASRVLAGVKTESWYKLPYTLLKVSAKGIKIYGNKLTK